MEFTFELPVNDKEGKRYSVVDPEIGGKYNVYEQKSNLFEEKDGIQPPHDIDKIKERVKTWNEISNILKNS